MGPCGGKIPIACVSEVTVAVLLGSGAACLGSVVELGLELYFVAGFKLLEVTFCCALKTCPFKVWYCSSLNLLASDATKSKKVFFHPLASQQTWTP